MTSSTDTVAGPAAEVPSPEVLVERARALRPKLIEAQAETEERTYYSEELHRDFLEAGFYKMLVPRRYGGYELDMRAFARVIIEIARGCPSTGWSLCLPSGHALQVASWFERRAQDEIFGSGDFRCPAVAAPFGTAWRAADGGWVLDGTHRYCSGAPYGTHFLGQSPVEGDGAILLFIAPRSEWTRLDDWGDTLGLRGSGSHSILFDHGRIPDWFALENTLMVDVDVSGGSPGSRLHGNPIFAGRAPAFFSIELGALVVGMARGALDEYETIIRTRKTQRPPIVARYLDPDYQRWFGLALGRVEAAEALLIETARQYIEACRCGVEEGAPFDRQEDLRLGIMGREVCRLVWETMQDTIYKTAGTSAARNGERMERIFRDLAMAWGHFNNVLGDASARDYGREYLGATGEKRP